MGANASHEPLGTDATRGAAKPHSPGNLFSPYGRASLRKSLRRRKSKRKQKENQKEETHANQVEGPNEAQLRKMDKLRKSFRDSFRKKKDAQVPESSKPHLWQSDESAVRAGTCSFQVKYMGCVEVYESRGMQVCEEAVKVLRNSRRRPVRGILYVSGDGLRVVDDETKGLIVDQTIEKVSFCAPDRNHERGFSYICRDGTTRRWMCHGFIAVKETGERLSHAVGCAFAACLERKQKRDRECGVTMTFDQSTSTFTRLGSFRQMTVTERLSDPQECKPIAEPVPVKKVENPHAIARPHATPQLLQRQGSFRVFDHLNQSSPFKRQLSLRLSDLPSNIERTRALSLDTASFVDDNSDNNLKHNNNNNIPATVAPIPESSPLVDTMAKPDAVSAMCQQVSAGLSLLSNFPEDNMTSSGSSGLNGRSSAPFSTVSSEGGGINGYSPVLFTSSVVTSPPPAQNIQSNVFGSPSAERRFAGAPPVSGPSGLSKGEEWLAQINSQATHELSSGVAPPRRNPPLSQLRSSSLGSYPQSESPVPRTDPQPSNFSTSFSPSMANGNSPVGMNSGGVGLPFSPSRPPTNDPFDAEWAALSPGGVHNPNNPFLQSAATKTFQVLM